MSKHYPIIIPEIYDKSPICDYTPQTAKVLSALGYPVYIFLINYPPQLSHNLEKAGPNFHYFYPLKLLPLNRFHFIHQAEIYLSFNLLYLYCLFKHLHRPLYWNFYPHFYRVLKFSLPPKFLIYDIFDFFTSPDPQINTQITNGKKYLLKKANLVTAISHHLISQYQQILPSVKINLVPQGFHLVKSASEFSPLKKLSHLTKKIGFVGALNNRFDYQLLFGLIKNNPHYNFIFVGPEGTDINVSLKPVKRLNHQLFSYPNVFNLGPANKDQIKSVIDFFDIAIIPYDTRDDFNRYCYPMKIFEYFACQKPVVSTPIEELKQFPHLVKIGNSVSEWQQHLDYFFAHPLTAAKKKQAQKLAKDNSWENKVNKILSLISL